MKRRSVDRSTATVTLADHLKELKSRLFILVVVLLGASSMVYVYREYIIPVILAPYKSAFGEEQLMYLNPAGGFNFIFFISIYAGLAATLPVLIQQIYLFIRPTLPKSKQRIAGRLLIWSTILLIAGILFGYFIAIPGALGFLKDFATEYVSASLTADSYLHFLISYTIGLGLLFQFPLLLVVIHYIKPLAPIQLLKSERWVIVFCMVAAAIITPTPDPVNMLIVATPLLVIYQIGAVVVLVSIFRSRKKAKIVQSRKTTPVVQATAILQPEPQLAALSFLNESQTPASPNLANQLTKSPKSPLRSIDGMRSAQTPYSASITRREPPTLRRIERPSQTYQRPLAQPQHRRPISGKYIDGISPVLEST